jgi:Outer membrane lipoprotein-sorting protein
VISTAQRTSAVLVCLAAAVSASAQSQIAVPTSDTIVAQMSQAQTANRIQFLPYTVTRDYRLFGGETSNSPKSHVVADIVVVPPDSKKYTIQTAVGSVLAERIVRKALDSEVAFANDSRATDITRENYDFALVGENELNGRLCYVLELSPKRKSKNLLHGTLWVDAETHLPRRVEGAPAKDPSWWFSEVQIVLLYGYVGPMWVQTSSTASANVRIIGRSTMVWQDTSYQLGDFPHRTSLAESIAPPGETGPGDHR